MIENRWIISGLLVVMGTALVDSTLSSIFGRAEQFAEIPGNGAAEIYHMEVDEYKNDGSILFGCGYFLISTNGTHHSNVSVNPLRHKSVTGFTQLNSTHVAVPIGYWDCIIIVNRRNNVVQDFAGTCGDGSGNTAGNTDGVMGIGKLNNPWGITKDIKNLDRLLVTDAYNGLLRYVNKNTGELGTIVGSSFMFPRAMTWVGNSLFVTDRSFITEVNWSSGEPVTTRVIGDLVQDDVDGSFTESRFLSLFSRLVEVQDGLYLLADAHNFKLKLVNMNTEEVSSTVILPVSTIPEIFRPLSLLKVGEELYVSSLGDGIYKLSCMTILEVPCYCGAVQKTL